MALNDIMKKYRKWSLTVKIIPIVIFILALKYFFHLQGYEIMDQHPFVPSLIAAAVFLIGFLLSGVLSDFKESEKIPGEIASSIDSMADEAYIIYRNKKAPEARQFVVYLIAFTKTLEGWLHTKVRTQELMAKLRGMNDYFLKFEPLTQATFIARMKQEQQNLRKSITRIHTIKDTSFIHSGYAIAEGITVLLILTLLITKLDPFFESMFFLIPITYLLVYMISLIKDLDNPFEYGQKGESVEEVSIKEIHDEIKRLDDRLAELDTRDA